MSDEPIKLTPPFKIDGKHIDVTFIENGEKISDLILHGCDNLEDALLTVMWGYFREGSTVVNKDSRKNHLWGWYNPYMSNGEWAAELLYKAGKLVRYTEYGDPVPEEEVQRMLQLGIREDIARNPVDHYWYLPLEDFTKIYGYTPDKLQD